MNCPVCGTGLSMAHLLVNADDRAAVVRLLALSTPLGAAVGRYISLFTPPKTSLTLRKQVRIVLQLLPDLERRAITHRGRDWSVPLKVWEAGIDQMLAARDAGKLDLPMKGHAYLYTILMSLADKTEAVAETQHEAQRRTSAATFQVRGQTLPMGQALDQVFGDVDPTLARLDAEAGKAAPVPDSARALLQNLKQGKKA
ncbi:hypothetical protein [Rhodoferax sp.]|uniref:hypothetical protein n=1 Tax=Rhodoferax sp. TaxID=50421 RepID=UPI00284D4931|nr:hypothetical protein [Rhodoferax sp.]MDR3370700.1 hypothetical protein [Rhodoferax sp.]